MKQPILTSWIPGPFLMVCAGVLLSAPGLRAATVQFSSGAYTVKESTSAARIVVTRTGNLTESVSVDFATEDSGGGTAIPDIDYAPTNGTLTFGPGVTTRYIYVPILNDTSHEGNETVVLDLSNLSSENFVFGTWQNTTLTIQDNDACTYAINPASRTHDEIPTFASFQVVAPDGCYWAAEKTASWIGFVSSSGVGNGEVSYSCDALPEGVSSRSTTIKVGGQTFTITQRKPPADLAPPSILISFPLEGSRQTNTEITVRGRATDDIGVTLVEVRLENSDGVGTFAPATGTASWTTTVSGLTPGTNVIRVRAHDAAANLQEAVRTVVFVEVGPIDLSLDGMGTVTPLINGHLLDVGKDYTVQARPAVNQFFSGWSGGVESTDNPLTFTMQQGLGLQAHFVPSPFVPLAGLYTGLFMEETTVRHQSSGLVTLALTGPGAFSAKAVVGGKRLSFSGHFALDGGATNTVDVPGAGTLTVLLNVDLGGGVEQITGSVSGEGWTAGLQLFRKHFDARVNQSPQAGRYTTVIPGDVDHAATEPGGDGFGTVLVGLDGLARLSATLADGVRIAHRAPIAANGYWPVYVPLYRGQGALVGWVSFEDVPGASDFTGNLNWIKPAGAGPGLYTNGFTALPAIVGSRYQAPTNLAGRILTLTEGRLAFSAGNLAASFENLLTLSADGKVANLGENTLACTIQKSTGLFTGTVTPPGSASSVLFRGAVLQKMNAGFGFFTGSTQSGRVVLSE